MAGLNAAAERLLNARLPDAIAHGVVVGAGVGGRVCIYNRPPGARNSLIIMAAIYPPSDSNPDGQMNCPTSERLRHSFDVVGHCMPFHFIDSFAFSPAEAAGNVREGPMRPWLLAADQWDVVVNWLERIMATIVEERASGGTAVVYLAGETDAQLWSRLADEGLIQRVLHLGTVAAVATGVEVWTTTAAFTAPRGIAPLQFLVVPGPHPSYCLRFGPGSGELLELRHAVETAAFAAEQLGRLSLVDLRKAEVLNRAAAAFGFQSAERRANMIERAVQTRCHGSDGRGSCSRRSTWVLPTRPYACSAVHVVRRSFQQTRRVHYCCQRTVWANYTCFAGCECGCSGV